MPSKTDAKQVKGKKEPSKSVKPAAKAKKALVKKEAKQKIDIHLLPMQKDGIIVEQDGKKIRVNSVTLQAGTTIPTVDFGNTKFSVMISLTALDEKVTVEELSEFGWDYIAGELGRKIKAVNEKYGRK